MLFGTLESQVFCLMLAALFGVPAVIAGPVQDMPYQEMTPTLFDVHFNVHR
jgi:hypothetical protein